MASPQKENGHARTANELLDALARTSMNGREAQIMRLVERETYGFSRKTAHLPGAYLEARTGSPRTTPWRSSSGLSASTYSIAMPKAASVSRRIICAGLGTPHLLPNPGLLPKQGVLPNRGVLPKAGRAVVPNPGLGAVPKLGLTHLYYYNNHLQQPLQQPTDLKKASLLLVRGRWCRGWLMYEFPKKSGRRLRPGTFARRPVATRS